MFFFVAVIGTMGRSRGCSRLSCLGMPRLRPTLLVFVALNNKNPLDRASHLL